MKKLAVLGPGCAKCNKLHKETEQAAEELGVEFELVKITDLRAISGFGVMMTPALIVDGEVKVVGKVPSVAELMTMIGDE